MNTALLIMGAIAGLVVAAALIEAYFKSKKYRPLSSFAVTKRRWDDPANDPSDDRMIVETPVYNHRGDSGERKQWSVPKDPTEYARAMMPAQNKETRK